MTEPEHRIADHGACDGEDRADPDSWDDPDICAAWSDPPEIEPADTPIIDGLG